MMSDDPNVCERCSNRRDDIGLGGCFCPPDTPAVQVRFNFSVSPPGDRPVVHSDFIYVTGYDAVAAACVWCAQRRYTRSDGYTISVCIMEGADCRVVTNDAEWHVVVAPPAPDQRALAALAAACGWGDLPSEGLDAAGGEAALQSYVSRARARARSEREAAAPLRAQATRLETSAAAIETALRGLTEAGR